MSTIESLEITNFQNVSAVKIEPTNNVIMLFGKNAAGKTSVLDAIETTFCKFNARVTKRPIKDGAGRADIKIKMTDGTFLHQKFTPSGPTLTGKKADGGKLGQRDLDQAMSLLGVDAAAFINAGEKKQLEILLSIVDLPFVPAELDAEIKDLEAKRLLAGQQGKAIGDFTVDPNLAVEETSASDLVNQVMAAQQQERINRGEAENLIAMQESHVELYERIQRLQAEWKALGDSIETQKAHVLSLPVPADVAALEAQLSTVEDANAAIRANNTAREQIDRKNALRAEWEKYDAHIKEVQQRKADGLAAAEMPVEGLSFDEEGVLYQGVPFSRASGAEQIIVSAAMIIATNPEVRTMVIRNGNMMDETSLQTLQSMCEDNEFQAFVEFVSDSEDHEFRLVDGELA